MKFTRQRMALFFPMPLDAQDWANLEASRVRTVMLLLGTSTRPDDLTRLRTMGRRVILRVSTGMVMRADASVFVRGAVAQVDALCPVDAVLLGNEVDGPFNLAYDSPDWGQQAAYRWLVYYQAVRVAVQGLGIPVVSPALTARSISEDETPSPGRSAWVEITRLEYDQSDMNAGHLYAYGWRSDVDRWRFKKEVQRVTEYSHKMVFLDEVGVPLDNDIEQMAAHIEQVQILESTPLGERIALLCPFVSNGTGVGWDPRYIMRDIQAYRNLGAFLAGDK